MDEIEKLVFDPMHYDLIAKLDYWTINNAINYLTTYYMKDKKFTVAEVGAKEFNVVYDLIYDMVKNSVNKKILVLDVRVTIEKYDERYGPYDALVLGDSKVSSVNFIDWAYKKDLDIPAEFSILLPNTKSDDTSDATKKLTPTQTDKLICQAIAKTLWYIYPNKTNEELQKHYAIQVFGNGRSYKGKNTLRDWLSEVDTRSEDVKPGGNKKQ